MKIRLPYSKSVDLRLLALKYVAEARGVSMPEVVPESGTCRDTSEFGKALRELMQAGGSRETKLYISEGAAPFRFLLALAASSPGKRVLIRIGRRLSQRPHAPLTDALRAMGASVERISESGFSVVGRRLSGGSVRVDSALSSQYLSALLLASPLWKEQPDLSVDFGNVQSRPYLEMTRRMLGFYLREEFLPDREPDWSAAAFWIEGELLARSAGRPFPKLDMEGLLPFGVSLQGDSRAGELAKRFLRPGVMMEDMSATPDLVPAFAFLCGLGRKRFNFTGVGNLRYKESDRLEAIRMELGKFGCRVSVGSDHIEGIPAGEPTNKVIHIDSHGDHRIAMAAAMAVFAGWSVDVDNPEVVKKSYPEFWEHLNLAINSSLQFMMQ